MRDKSEVVFEGERRKISPGLSGGVTNDEVLGVRTPGAAEEATMGGATGEVTEGGRVDGDLRPGMRMIDGDGGRRRRRDGGDEGGGEGRGQVTTEEEKSRGIRQEQAPSLTNASKSEEGEGGKRSQDAFQDIFRQEAPERSIQARRRRRGGLLLLRLRLRLDGQNENRRR